MKYTRSIELQDKILNYLKDNPEGEISTKYLSAHLQRTYGDNLTDAEMAALLRQLLRDRHITTIESGLHKITFEGILFIEDGGYAVQRKAGYIKRQYVKLARRSGNQTPTVLPWFLATCVLVMVYLLLRYGYEHWNWKIPF